MTWDLQLNVNAQSGAPMYQRIAQAIALDIEHGRLKDGARLPGTRRLANLLGVHRNTTLAAYRELEDDGRVDTSPSRGTFVTSPKAPSQATVPKRVRFPTDGDGLCVDRLPEVANQGRLRSIYVTPHHQHPTTVALSPTRRQALLSFAETHRVAVLEDDYDHEFSYDGTLTCPLASNDRSGVVVYFGSLSKRLGPGIRLGYTIAPAPMLEAMAERRALVDRQGDHGVALAVATLLNDELRHHHRAMEREFRHRREVLAGLLASTFGDTLEFAMPNSGTAFWVRAKDVDVDAWHRSAAAQGVAFSPGRAFRFDEGRSEALRLGYAGLDGTQLRMAVARLSKALDAIR